MKEYLCTPVSVAPISTKETMVLLSLKLSVEDNNLRVFPVKVNANETENVSMIPIGWNMFSNNLEHSEIYLKQIATEENAGVSIASFAGVPENICFLMFEEKEENSSIFVVVKSWVNFEENTIIMKPEHLQLPTGEYVLFENKDGKPEYSSDSFMLRQTANKFAESIVRDTLIVQDIAKIVETAVSYVKL